MSPVIHARRARVVLLVLAVVALPLALTTMPSAASAAAGVHPAGGSGGTTTVYRAENVCGDPLPGQATCFAERLVARQVATGSAAALSTPARGSSGTGPAGGFTPTQVAQAYGVVPAAGADAGDQVVAIVGAYHSPALLQHLATFDARYGLAKESTATIRVLNGADGSSVPPTTTGAGWAGEADLDVQAVRGMCPTCKILVVETVGPGSNRLAKGVDIAADHTWVRRDGIRLPVSVLTTSYGRPEIVDDSGSRDSDGDDYYHPGVVVLAAAGDSGWYRWDDAVTEHPDDPDVLALADVPASFPAVIGVGGTTLEVDAAGARRDEHVWDSDGNEGRAGTGGATGSGCSFYSALPWELDAPGYDTLGCTQSTSSVNVAAVADPYTGYDVATAGGWATFGGTSLASSLVAGMWALAGGAQGASLPEQTLYQHLAAGTDLYDVTAGGNGACGTDSRAACSHAFGANPNALGHGQLDCRFAWSPGDYRFEPAPNQCNARAGLDGPSGVGTPTGLALFRPTNGDAQSATSARSARSARRASASPVIR